MKRRNFLASLIGIFAAPLVAKKAKAAVPSSKPYTVAVDWVRYPVNFSDRSSAGIVRIDPDGTQEVIYRFDEQSQELDRQINLAEWREKLAKFHFMGSHPKH